ncbi:hypothetical protein HPB52_023266 [Rhipicephalus sanguineus]|uniref:CCHC-type domain-containing protein n=1 Tax=Rhipicephalus sanguineus TaxID=34632 RepID=A0A9D4QB95_RHISA|nr:hypothetical protein HPB52_023266 [Rhipicephalus sanguineus]
MDMSRSRKRPRPEDSSDDEADGPRKLVLADPSTEEDTTSDSTTSQQSAESDSSEDSLPTSGDNSASPPSAASHVTEPAAHTPAAVPALADDTAVSEGPEEEMDDGNTSPPHSSRNGVSAIRINHKRNIVAAAVTTECLEQLLAVKELKGILVSAREPSDHRTSTGFLHGADGEPTDASLLPGIDSSVPVLSATREGSTVTLRVNGPVPPEYVTPFLVQFRVRPARPLQCCQCGRFGHVKETCNWPNGCIHYGQAQRGEENCQRQRCVNCGRPHSADTPACPHWQQERRVATIMASSTAPLSRKGVRAVVVREELQQDQVPRTEGYSYASVVQGSTTPSAPVQTAPPSRTSRPLLPAVRRQSWHSACSTISRNPDGARGWRLLRALLASSRALSQVLLVAVLLRVSIKVLVERLANRFADRPPVPPTLSLPTATTSPPTHLAPPCVDG